MNDPLTLPTADDDSRFDRLVDGELSPAEYKALLAALDEEPGGWRRCALAFLEAQALRQEFALLNQKVVPQRPAAVSTGAGAALAGWKLFLAIAASFLVALGMGIVLPSSVPALRDNSWVKVSWKEKDQSPEAKPDVSIVRSAPRRPGAAGDLRMAQPQAVGQVRLVLDGPGGTRTEAGEVPVFELSQGVADWPPGEPALPTELIHELKRRGHQVQWQQQLVPVDLGDGRAGVIPVEGYQITPVSRRAY